jgi:hypothetical protein
MLFLPEDLLWGLKESYLFRRPSFKFDLLGARLMSTVIKGNREGVKVKVRYLYPPPHGPIVYDDRFQGV